MILDDAIDPAMKLAAAQAFTDAGGGQVTALSHDLGDTTPIRDIGAGTPMCLLFTVNVAAAGSTDTFKLQAVTDTDPALGSPVAVASRDVLKANLTLGRMHIVPLPPGAPYERYLGGRVLVGAADTVTMTCRLAPQSDVVQGDPYYASGFDIDNIT